MCFCRETNRLHQQRKQNGAGHNRQARTPISHANRPQAQPANRSATLPVSPKKLS